MPLSSSSGWLLLEMQVLGSWPGHADQTCALPAAQLWPGPCARTMESWRTVCSETHWAAEGEGRDGGQRKGPLQQARRHGPHSPQRTPAEPPHWRLQNQLFQAAGSQTRPTGPWPRAAAPRWERPASRKGRGTRGCTDTAPSQGRVGATREEKMELLIANRCGRPFSCFQGRLGRIFLATK